MYFFDTLWALRACGEFWEYVSPYMDLLDNIGDLTMRKASENVINCLHNYSIVVYILFEFLLFDEQFSKALHLT